MKEVARYKGHVIRLVIPPEASTVRLTEVGTGNSVETGAVTETLIRAGIKEGDDFLVIVQESLAGQLSGVIRKAESTTETDFDI